MLSQARDWYGGKGCMRVNPCSQDPAYPIARRHTMFDARSAQAPAPPASESDFDMALNSAMGASGLQAWWLEPRQCPGHFWATIKTPLPPRGRRLGWLTLLSGLTFKSSLLSPTPKVNDRCLTWRNAVTATWHHPGRGRTHSRSSTHP